MDTTKRPVADYAIAWICPLRFEQRAALAMLDERHEYLPQAQEDDNLSFFGSVKRHNVVIAGLLDPPESTTKSAARVANRLSKTFPALRVSLLIGIGSGATTKTDEGPIRLGDVVVNKQTPRRSGIYTHLPQAASFEVFEPWEERQGISTRATECAQPGRD